MLCVMGLFDLPFLLSQCLITNAEDIVGELSKIRKIIHKFSVKLLLSFTIILDDNRPLLQIKLHFLGTAVLCGSLNSTK